MTTRTEPRLTVARRLTSRLFPSNGPMSESAISWLAADPVFAEAVAHHR